MSTLESITVTTFLAADHAEAVNGKLYVSGGCWDTLYARQFPATHPHMALALAFSVPYSETGELHSLVIDLLDEDGNRAVPFTIQHTLEPPRPENMRPGDLSTLVLAFTLEGLPLQQPGTFKWVLQLDGLDAASLPLHVRAASA